MNSAASVIGVGPFTVQWLSKSQPFAPLSPAALTPREKAHADSITAPLRNSEFVRSRALLHQWLSPTHDFTPDGDRMVAWPEGLCGSITHCQGHIGITTEPTAQWLSIGLDAEEVGRIHSGLETKLLLPEETSRLDAWSKQLGGRDMALALIFASKEALFKAIFPLGKKMFYFHDACVEAMDASSRTLEIVVRSTFAAQVPAQTRLRGYWTEQSEDHKRYVIVVLGVPVGKK